MANTYRGEIDAELDGKSHRLCLTLGALAELEHAFGDEDMLSLAERFSSGRLAAGDAVRIIGAGLRGGGHDISDQMVARMRVPKGASGFVEIVAQLLEATFGAHEAEDAPFGVDAEDTRDVSHPIDGHTSGVSDGLGAEREELAEPRPFPGAR
ncbi:MAG: gene transfer agent family protein [Pseudomonadota bacterium]